MCTSNVSFLCLITTLTFAGLRWGAIRPPFLFTFKGIPKGDLVALCILFTKSPITDLYSVYKVSIH